MPDIVGTWRLVAATSLDPEGRQLPLPYGPQAIGRIVFTADKRMMAALSDGRSELPAGTSDLPCNGGVIAGFSRL